MENLERRTLLSAAIAAFSSQQAFFTGNSPVALAIADLDRDGKPDLVVANNTDGTVGVFRGDGTGSFFNQQTFACGSEPFAIAVADFNGDGKLDLVVANYNSSSVTVLLGNGDGTFQPPHSFAAGNGPIAVTTADVNGDGKQDILVANYASGTVSVLDGNGDGTFHNQQTFAAGTHPISIAGADLNGDGKPDIAVTNYTVTNGTVSVLLGTGTGSFSARQTFAVGAKPRDLAISDLNRDGKPDLAVVNKTDGTASILLGNGDGTFQTQTTFAVGPSPNAIALADVNGDGKEDLIIAGGGTTYPAAAVLLGNGDGTFHLPATFATGSNPYALAVADLNGDGRLDLVTANQRGNTVSVLLGDVPPTVLSINRTNPPGPNAFGNTVGYTVTFNEPVTGVDATDFAMATTGTVTAATPVTVGGSGAVYTVTISGISGAGTLGLDLVDNGSIQDGAGNPLQPGGTAAFQAEQTFGAGAGVYSVAVADVNGDGKPDLLLANYSSGTVSVLLGNGNGTFQSRQTLDAGPSPWSIAVSDVNEDGRPDLVVLNRKNDTLSVLLGNGNGTFQTRQTYAAEPNTLFVTTSDVNGDGRPDLIVANGGQSTVGILLGNGNGTFQAQQTYAVGPLGVNPTFVAVSDVNGDGKPDLVVANNNGSTVSVLLGNGNGTFQADHTFRTGLYPNFVSIGDVNGDGIPDLLVESNRTISLLLGNGNGTFQTQRILASGYEPLIADVNGDGLPDVVFGSRYGIPAVLLGNGNGTFEPQQTFAGNLFPFAVADVNGDGRADLLGFNSAGNVGVLLGQSNGSFTGQTYSIVPLVDTVNGTAGVDQIDLIRDPDGQHIDWSLNAGPLSAVAINDPNGLTINSLGGNDQIFPDYTNGDPLPNILHLNGTFTINGLQGTNPLAGTSLDIGKSTVFINYANPASDPIAAIKGYLLNGYNSGAWTGSPTPTTGVITSLAAAGNPNHNTAIGYADSADGQGVNTVPNTIELTYTLYGDANLDHQVNSADLQILLFGLNRPGSWDQGDFNYDAQVNSADLQSLLFTLNTSLGSQAAPAQAAAATLAGAQSNQGTTKTAVAPPLMPAVSSKPTPVHPSVVPPHRANSRRHR